VRENLIVGLLYCSYFSSVCLICIWYVVPVTSTALYASPRVTIASAVFATSTVVPLAGVLAPTPRIVMPSMPDPVSVQVGLQVIV
jgi:hypothetical protein